MTDELLDIARFGLGFLPWLLFLLLPTNGWEPLRRAVLICLIASVVFSWKALRDRFILQWATVVFFLFCAISFYGFEWIWLANHMSIISNSVLDGIIWLTVATGKPFTLQYARAEAPRELWNTEAFIGGCRSIAIFWGVLLLFPTASSLFRLLYPAALPNSFYFHVTVFCMIFGVTYTTFFKRRKRKLRMAPTAQSN